MKFAAVILSMLVLFLLPAHAGTVTYEVDPASGRVTKATYADGSFITYTYDSNGSRTSAVVTLSADTTPPGNPTGLTTSGVTASAITLNWTASTDNRPGVTYRVERCTGASCSTFAQVGTPATNTFTNSSLTNGTSYSYRVRAVDAAGLLSASFSNTATAVTTDTTAPSAPGVPQFTSITSTSATASWTAATDNVGVTGYQYSLNGGSTWTNATSPVNLTGLTASTNYTLQVRARDAAGNFGTASSGAFSTGDTTPPSAPGTPTFGSITATSVMVSWTAATDNVGVTGYQYSINAGATWVNASSGVSITGLTNGTAYTVRVRARDAAGNFGTFSSASFNTTDTTAPGVPGTPTFTNVAQTSVTVSWTAATDNVGVTGYQYSINAGSTWVDASSGVTITGLTGNTAYTVRVRARDAAGNFGTFSSASFTTVAAADTIAPSAPGTPAFSSITGTSVAVSWSAATDNVAVTGYEYSLNGGGTWTAASSGVSITGLTNGTTYTVQVRARDAAGNRGTASSASFSTTDTTAPGVPGTPAFSSITGSSVTVSWSAATDNVAVTGYQYSINGGSTWVSASSGVSITGLTNGTSYTVQVRARDAAGNFGSPSSASFTTTDTAAPSAPGTPSFSSITGSSAVASWSAATDNVAVSGYEYSLNGGAWTGASSGVTLTGLANGTSYSLQVRAFDAAGNRGGASSASFSTTDTAAPSAPGTPTFSSITGTSAVASWGAASDNVGVSGYEYSLNGGGWTGAGSGVTLTGLANGTSYSLQVRAFDAAGNRGSASANSFTTLDTAAPSAPGTPSFSSVGATSAVVSFSAASDNVGVAGYEYLLNGAGWSVASSGMTLSGLSTGVSYTVHVRAFDAAGNRGDPSVNSFTTVDNIAPSAPGTPSFSSVGPTSAVASWTAASDNLGVARYEYSVNGGGWVNVGNTTSATVSGLSAGASNTVAVRAVDGAGNAGGSSSASVTTLAQITIANRNVNTVVPGFSGGAALYQLTSAGDIMTSQPSSSTVIDGGDWLAPKSDMGNFQVMSTQASSTACSSATHGTWLSLASNQTWVVGRGGPSGTTACSFDIQIRHSGNPSVILATARINLSITN